MDFVGLWFLAVLVDLCWSSEDDQVAVRQFTVEACDDQYFEIRCPTYTKIYVASASYGNSMTDANNNKNNNNNVMARVCAVEVQKNGRLGVSSSPTRVFDEASGGQMDFCESDATEKLTETCHNREYCSPNSTVKEFLGSHYEECRKKTKLLLLTYECKPSQFMSDNYCENSPVHLRCKKPNTQIFVYSASYGRKSSSPKASCNDALDNEDCSVDVTNVFHDRCNAKQKCSLNVHDAHMLTNAKHCSKGLKHKTLSLIHICVDKNIFADPSDDKIHFHRVWSPQKTSSEWYHQPHPHQFSPSTHVTSPDSTIPSDFNDYNTPNNHYASTTTKSSHLNDDSMKPSTMKSSDFDGSGFSLIDSFTTPSSSNENEYADIESLKCASGINRQHKDGKSSCLGSMLNFVHMMHGSREMHTFLATNVGHVIVYFGASVLIAAATTSLLMFSYNKCSSKFRKNNDHSSSNAPDVVQLPNLPAKIIDPLTLTSRY